MSARRSILGAILGMPIARIITSIKETKHVTTGGTPEEGMDPMPTFPLLGLTKFNSSSDRKVRLFVNREQLNAIISLSDNDIKDMIYRRKILTPTARNPFYFTLTDCQNVTIDSHGIVFYDALKGYSGERSQMAF